MPEEQDNPIERRESGGGIGRISEASRRGTDAARFVGGLTNRRVESGLPSAVSTDSTYEFRLKWGTEGTGDGQFKAPRVVAVAPDGSVYVTDYKTNRVQAFKRVILNGA